MKSNASAREEELRRYPDRYIHSAKSPDGRVLRTNHEIRDAVRAHFRDRFARCPDLSLQEFRSYLADFSRLGVAEAASCEGVITECVEAGRPQRIGWTRWFTQRSVHVCAYSDGCVQPLFAQGAIPGSITKGVITLMKKGGKHVWWGLDDYRLCLTQS